MVDKLIDIFIHYDNSVKEISMKEEQCLALKI